MSKHTMTQIRTITLLLLGFLAATAVTASWPLRMGGQVDELVNDVVTAPSGNTYVVGEFTGTLILGESTLNAVGQVDAFVAKISDQGIVRWAASFGGVSVDRGFRIAIDPSENVYVAGIFHAGMTLGDTLSPVGVSEAGDSFGDVFVAKWSGTGVFQWVAKGSGLGIDEGRGLVFVPGDATATPPQPDLIVIGGGTHCAIRFYNHDQTDDGGTENASLTLGSDAGCSPVPAGNSLPFLAALSADGNWQWSLGNAFLTYVDSAGRIDRLAVNSARDVFVLGTYNANPFFPTFGAGHAAGGPSWTLTTAAAVSGHSNHIPDTPARTDAAFEMDYFISLPPGASATLRFKHRHDFDRVNDGVFDPNTKCHDAGVVEYNIAGGPWENIYNFADPPNGWNTWPKIGWEAGEAYPPATDNPIGDGTRAYCYFRNPHYPGFTQETITLDSLAGNAVRFRWRFGADTGNDPPAHPGSPTGWYIDDLSIVVNGQTVLSDGFEPYTGPGHFLGKVINATSPTARAWSWADRIPRHLAAHDLVIDASDRILIAGTKLDGSAGALVARGVDAASGIAWEWTRVAAGGEGKAVTLDASGNIYLTGVFNGSTFACKPGHPTLSQIGGYDVFVAKMDPNGSCFSPGSGGGALDPGFTDASAIRAGSSENDTVSAISGTGSELYIGGSFKNTASFGVGENKDIVAVDSADAYLANLGTGGVFFQVVVEDWTVGEMLTPPPGAYLGDAVNAIPEVFVEGVETPGAIGTLFFWHPPPGAGATGALYPLKEPEATAAKIEIHWRANGDPLSPDRIVTTGIVSWPSVPCTAAATTSCFQQHVAGAPVEILPDDDVTYPRSFIQLVAETGSDAQVTNNIFTATTSHYATIVYARSTNPDIQTNAVDFEVVKTSSARQDNSCTIGIEITDTAHTQTGRSGYVFNPNAFYDGVGANAALNRDARIGQIFAVNKMNLDNRPVVDAGKEMEVAWYRTNHITVSWAEKKVRYDCQWPATPNKIIVASQQGTELGSQPGFDPLAFPQLHVYHQSDPNQPGFNPNDEHALLAPSNRGLGFQAIFALRADFGGTIAPTAASDPYVLAKYRDPGDGKWRFNVYKVEAEDATWDFTLDGTAATPVSAPYPVSLLQPCPDQLTVCAGGTCEAPGDPQPPLPFYRDTNQQLWARSAGTGEARYHYPIQPSFFYDLNGDDVTDLTDYTCIPWMARLPAAAGGTADTSTPLEVTYDIAWPADIPLLQVGETLLKPKRGLPDVFNQAAVRVIFDQYRQACQDPVPANRPATCQPAPLDPKNALVQLIDPLSPRTAALSELPTGSAALATEFDAQGLTVITGNADGTKRLPYALHSRLRYDPLTKLLTFRGLFDESGAGEPLLLLNVMLEAERDQLLALSSESKYQTAIGELFAKSRNPHGVQVLCPDASGGTCRAVDTNGDVLIAFEDSDGDGLLESFAAEGINAALTAGAAQGTGFVTLVFNDSESLALPVGMQVIEVGCLEIDPGPPAVESPYVGQIQVIAPANTFDEQLTLRHSGDFGALAEVHGLEFEWYVDKDVGGTPPALPPDPDGSPPDLGTWQQILGSGGTALGEQITLGPGLDNFSNAQVVSDNWFLVRYRGLPECNNASTWSVFAGQPGSPPTDPRAQLAEGWVKRVVERLNPFDARVGEFHTAPTSTFASMIGQFGERYEGPIALNDDPANVNSVGLIEAYETVMRRVMQLSIGATPAVNYEPANSAILNVASRLADFYLLLGNEAFADAQDPTIGISTDEVQFGFGTLAPTIFNFQNQTASLLEEELGLLRGRDETQGATSAPPVYNRFFWNFTQGDGEVAYALSYNIFDHNQDGFINETDARILFPQGHGDAWGHYLTSLTTYYTLLRHSNYTWNPRTEFVSVAGAPVQVDYLDERKFARAAAARARAGAEIVDLTYRASYVEDPAGQWQGYKDTAADRAWGVDGWGRRAGQGALFDWVVGNAILQDVDPESQESECQITGQTPPDCDDTLHTGIRRIDRTTVDEFGEIIAAYSSIQEQVDEADRGLNPLGLAKGVVPFDVDPTRVDAGETHFEQVFDRAVTALSNAVQVWDFANQLNRMLRLNQDSVDELTINARDRELDFKSRLIEVFGRPYAEDVGAGGTYPAGYDGPDLYHYNYVDLPTLAGTTLETADPALSKVYTVPFTYKPMSGGLSFFGCDENKQGDCDNAFNQNQSLGCATNPLGSGCTLGETPDINVVVDTELWQPPDFGGLVRIMPGGWTVRPAAGKVQEALNEVLNAQIALRKALEEYKALEGDLNATITTLRATFNIRDDQLQIVNSERKELQQLTIAMETLRASAMVIERVSKGIDESTEAVLECVPDNMIFGLAGGGDIFAGVACSIESAGLGITFGLDTAADGLNIAANSIEAAKEDVSLQSAIELRVLDARLEQYNLTGEITVKLLREPVLRTELFARAQILEQSKQRYRTALAEGLRIFEQLVVFRKTAAAATQEYRHQDMAFRVFRNDALQKYRAAFDMAARYTYLAATAYDYETNLLGTDARSGRDFLTDIVRQRSVGQLLNGEPVAGSPGLADPIGRMDLNFQVLKGQMGFNNPQIETNRFSLRRELLRLSDAASSDDAWRRTLETYEVADLWAVPEFRRFARPFAPESSGAQPGLVIPFETTVTFGLNFFKWPLGSGDSAYDPSQFATRIRSVGVWFDDYGTLPLSQTPRVYLVPAGADVLRPPTAGEFATREWAVVDQLIPVPFPIGGSDLGETGWSPLTDTLSGSFDEIRRFGSFKAFDFDPGAVFDAETTTDSRLIGRSVWNTRWLLIIPGGTLLNDADVGLETFIGDAATPGVRDVLIFFKTYAYSGF